MLISFLPPPIPRWRQRNDPASLLHDAWIWLAWRRGNWGERCLFVLMIILWPAYVLLAAIANVIQFGGRPWRDCKKTRLRQFIDLLRLGFFHHTLPRYYYMFDLYRHADDDRVHEYLHRTETKSFLYVELIDHAKRLKKRPPFVNKPHFAELCHDHGLAVVPTLAVAVRGKLLGRDKTPVDLPAIDLFLKPSGLRGGMGAEIWTYENGIYRRQASPTTDNDRPWTALVSLFMKPSFGLAKALLAARMRRRGAGDAPALDASRLRRYIEDLPPQLEYMVQPCLRSHRDLADLSFGTLTTVRVVTCVGLDGRAEVTHASYRMPMVNNAVVDNFHAGGIAAPIEIATGCLGRATDMGLRSDSTWHARHPLNGAPIDGRILPLWQDAAELACRAHLAFGDRPIVGWDIAILDDGPCLIEGNGRPDVDLIQRPYSQPLGNSRFGQILAEHIAHKCAAIRQPAVLDQGAPVRH